MTAVLHPGDHIHIVMPVEANTNAAQGRAAAQAAHDELAAFYAKYGVTVALTTTMTAPIPTTVIAVFRPDPDVVLAAAPDKENQ